MSARFMHLSLTTLFSVRQSIMLFIARMWSAYRGVRGMGDGSQGPDLLNNDRAGKTPCRPTTLHVEARLFGPICWAAYEFQDSSVMLSS